MMRPGLTYQVVAPYVPGFLKHAPPSPCRAAWHCSHVWKPQWWCPWLLKQYRGAKDFVALNAWAAFDEGIVMSTTVPAIVARRRILLAVDVVTRIWPSQSVDSAPALEGRRDKPPDGPPTPLRPIPACGAYPQTVRAGPGRSTG
jgi:hypothetical protein